MLPDVDLVLLPIKDREYLNLQSEAVSDDAVLAVKALLDDTVDKWQLPWGLSSKRCHLFLCKSLWTVSLDELRRRLPD